MFKLKECLMKAIGLEVVTNREAIMEELDALDGEKFATLIGLVFNEPVAEQMRASGITNYAEWLEQPVTLKTILS